MFFNFIFGTIVFVNFLPNSLGTHFRLEIKNEKYSISNRSKSYLLPDDDINCSTTTEKSNSSELQYYTNMLQTPTADTTLAIQQQQQSENPVTNKTAQCISISSTKSSAVPLSAPTPSPHQTPSPEYINLPCNSQSSNLPQFKSSITNTIIVLSKSTSDTVNVCQSQTQALPSFTVLQPQYAPVSPIDPRQISSEPLQSYQMSPTSEDVAVHQPQTPIGSSPINISLGLATSIQPANSTKQLMIDSPDTSLTIDPLPVIDARPSSSLDQSLLDDVPFDFPFRMDDLYRPSPSADSGYSPSQSTTSSGLTPQYFLNGPNSIDSGILNSPSLAMTASPKESTELLSMRLPSFNDVCSSVASLSSLNSSGSPLQHGFSETGSIYSVDSGHPSESPTQLLHFSDSGSHYSSASPNSCNPRDSPLQMHHSNDMGMDCGGPMLLPHFKDGEMSLHLDHFMDSAQPLSSGIRYIRPSPMLDHFTDTSSGCFDSYENLLNDVDMPLKLPQFTDADLKQALPPTHSTDSNGPLELEDMYKVRRRRAATMDPKPMAKEQPTTEMPRTPPGKLLEIQAIQEPSNRPFEHNCTESSALCSTADLSHKHPSEPPKEMWKKSIDLSRPVQFPSALKRIISIIPLPAAKPDEPKTITSPLFDKDSTIMKELRRLATTNSMSIQAIPLTEEPAPDAKRNIVMEPSRLEISVVNVENKIMPSPTSDTVAKYQSSTDIQNASIEEPTPKRQRSDPNRKPRDKSAPKSISLISSIKEEILPAISTLLQPLPTTSAGYTTGPIAATKTIVPSKPESSPAITPPPSSKPKSTPPIATIDLSSDQNEINHTVDSSTAQWQPQQALNSGKLQLLSDCLPRCSVILERIDIVNSGILLQDLNNAVQNNDDKTITIPKQYTINNHVKNKRIRKGGVELEQIDKTIQDVCVLICEMCQRECSNVTEILEHYRDAHNIRGYVRCCKKKYFSRGPLMEHIRGHGSSRIKFRYAQKYSIFHIYFVNSGKPLNTAY